MNAVVQGQLTRLEAALDALVDSITTYNPSPPAATRLLAVDAELSHELDRLSAHQRNARALQQLRATSEQLDTRIKTTLATLADTRKELMDRAAPPQPSAGIDYELLLSTAQRIAPFTRPPARVPRPAQPGDASQSAATQTSEQAEQQHLGRAAPAVLDEQQQAYLDPGTAGAASFTPWPSETAIWAGALGRLRGGQQLDATGETNATAEGENDDDGGARKAVNGDGSGGAAAPARTAAAPSGEDVERRRAEAEARRRQQEEELGAFELYNPDED